MSIAVTLPVAGRRLGSGPAVYGWPGIHFGSSVLIFQVAHSSVLGRGSSWWPGSYAPPFHSMPPPWLGQACVPALGRRLGDAGLVVDRHAVDAACRWCGRARRSSLALSPIATSLRVRAADLAVEEDRVHRRVGVVRVVLHELVVPAQLGRVARDVERDERVGVEVAALVAVHGEVRAGVAGRDEQRLRGRVDREPAPHRRAAVLPRVAGPGLVAGLAGTGNRLPVPHLVAVLRAERAHLADVAEVAARGAQDDLAVVDVRRHREPVVLRVVALVGRAAVDVEGLAAGARVERDDAAVLRREEDLAVGEADPAVDRVRQHVARRVGELPLERAGRRVEREHAVVRGRDVHVPCHTSGAASCSPSSAISRRPRFRQRADVGAA